MYNFVLVTSSGSMSSECVTSSLKSMGYKVLGTDIYPKHWVGVENYFHNLHIVPYCTEPTYISEILKICKESRVKFIFPLTDFDVDVFNIHRNIFIQNGITLCMSGEKCINIARNKLTLSKLDLKSIVGTIPTVYKKDITKLSKNKKILAKPLDGRSSIGQYIFNSAKDIPSNLDKGYIFQNVINGDVFVVDLVRDIYGTVFALTRKENLRTSHGAGTSVYVHKNETLELAAKEIGEAIESKGAINIEFIFDGKNYYLMDINPRFSAGIAFSNLSGFDFIKQHLLCFQNKKIVLPKNCKTNYHAVKRYITICTEGCDA